MKDSHGNALPHEIQPAAKWTDDCQGKKDFDGWLVSISTRYYPGQDGGGGTLVSNGKISTVPYGPRSTAHSSINILFGEADENGYNADYFMLVEQDFAGDTEDVKQQVEAWVRSRANEIKTALLALYSS